MRATKFEFEQRFWIFGAIFWLAFSLSFLDHSNFAIAILNLVSPSTVSDRDRGNGLLHLIFSIGALLVFLAALLRTWATAYLRTDVVHDVSQHSETLVADGPYRFVRNPLYLANLPLAAGIGFMASRLGWFGLVGMMWLFVYRLILREESGLLQGQGESYGAYLRAVPRLLPSLTPRLPSSAGQAGWAQAFAGEVLFWFFAAAMLCFAITLNLKLTFILFVASFPVYFISVYLVKKRSAARNT